MANAARVYQGFIVWKRPIPSHGHAASNGHGQDREDRGRVGVHPRYVETADMYKAAKRGASVRHRQCESVDHIFAPRGTTIRIAKGDKAKTQVNTE